MKKNQPTILGEEMW